MIILVVEKPRRKSDQDKLGEKLRPTNRSDDSDHSGNRVTNVSTVLDSE
uniref:Uncharacterized protein n=1 Tax=Arabidopsis thaliana TaxID=3702 RepID=Q0WMM1_ARATH|nr:hypothetical protein [Arabidopsis thaliana]